MRKINEMIIDFLVNKIIATSSEQNPFYAIFKRYNFHILRDHYYSPIPNSDEVSQPFWNRISDLPGVDIKPDIALRLVADLVLYIQEFRDTFPLRGWEEDKIPIINGSYMAVDGHMYYSLIRHIRPKRIVEIGAGNSTIMALAALERNREEGCSCNYDVIEPYPLEMVQRALESKGTLIREKLQNISLDFFTSLESDDILFIDSSHVLRSGNDVWYEYLEILPRLMDNVYVHIHDISLPKEYPAAYYDSQLFWNEQYLLQAFLSFNNKFSVIWPGNYMMVHFPEKMRTFFPEIAEMRKEFPQSHPTAFWMKS